MNKLIPFLAILAMFLSLSHPAHANNPTHAKKQNAFHICKAECDDKGSIKGGELVHQRAIKEISKEEYDKLARMSHNEDLICIRNCSKQGKKK